MKTHRCRIVPALNYLARGLSIWALLMAAGAGSARAGRPVDDAAKNATPAPSTPAPQYGPFQDSAPRTPAPLTSAPRASGSRDSAARDSSQRAISLVAYDSKGKQVARAEGFFVSSTGIVATVRHLLKNAARVTAAAPSGKPIPVGGLLAADPLHDVVLLQTDAQKTPVFARSDFQHLDAGTEVSIGNRGGAGQQAGGVIIRADDLVQGYHWILIKGIAAQGLGGSPIFAENGELVGMIRDELKQDAPGAAVSIESIDELVKRLPAQAAAKPVTEFKSRTYDELLDDPDFREALSSLEHKDFLTATTRMSHAAEQFPESAACRVFLGTFQTEMKSWAAAEQSYKTAIKLDPENALAWGYIGIPLYYQGKAAEGVAACKKSIAIQRDNFGAWTNLGGIYIMQGNLTAASELIDQLKEFHSRTAYKIADRLSAGLANAAAAKGATK